MTELRDNIFAIKVPEGTAGIKFRQSEFMNSTVSFYDQFTNKETLVELPGNCTHLFNTIDVTNEQAASAVEKLTEQVLSIRHILGYKAYNNEKIWKNGYLSNYPFRTATESLQSLLKSKGLTAGNYLIIKKVGT